MDSRHPQDVAQHLTGLLGTVVEVRMEITAANQVGFDDKLVRDVSEDARTLDFDDIGL